MTYDLNVPVRLREHQTWFSSIITRPIDESSQINPLSPSGRPISEEAAEWITPSCTLKPYQRIQIYNQQYWWRLLSTLHKTFPLVVRLYGYRDFNDTIAVPYLQKYISNHWSLSHLGNRLPQWVENDYFGEDKPLILSATLIDWAYNIVFLEKHEAPLINEDDLSTIFEKKAKLQPHIHLFSMPNNLFQFREQLIAQEPEYWDENPFPKLLSDKQYHFILYRTVNNFVTFEEVTKSEYQLLQKFRSGTTLEKALQWIESQDNEVYREAAENLHLWMQKWTVHQWLTQ